MRSDDCTEYAFGPYRVRADERVLRFDGAQIALAPKLVDTLITLVAEPDRFVSKAELLERIWPDGFIDEANLTQNIYVLRKLFAEHQSGVRIDNVPKRGYRLIAPVRSPVSSNESPSEAGPARDTSGAGPLRETRPASAAVFAGSARRATSVRRFVPALAIACALLLGIGGPVTAPDALLGPSAYHLAPAALERYLLGRYYLNCGTQRDLQRSIASFSQLVREYPQSALGYAGLAAALTSLTFATADPAARTRLSARAIGLANEAVVRAPDSTDAHAALGAVQTSLEHDDGAASRSFQTALRLDPRNLDALVWYGTESMNEGRVTDAQRLFKRAMGVDPDAPGPIASLAWADFLAHDFAAAAAFSRQLLHAHQLESIARITLASSYVEMGDLTRAMPEVKALGRQRDTQTQAAALLSQIYALRGSRRRALDTLVQLEAGTDPARIGSWDILALAAAYARLGRHDAAFVWLARIRSSERPQIARDPRFDQLRSDPRLRDWLSG